VLNFRSESVYVVRGSIKLSQSVVDVSPGSRLVLETWYGVDTIEKIHGRCNMAEDEGQKPAHGGHRAGRCQRSIVSQYTMMCIFASEPAVMR
jgi:hypothetical protein